MKRARDINDIQVDGRATSSDGQETAWPSEGLNKLEIYFSRPFLRKWHKMMIQWFRFSSPEKAKV